MAFDFDGTNDYLECASAALAAPGTPLTMAIWFNSDSATVSQNIFCLGSTTGSDAHMLQIAGAVAGDPVRAFSGVEGGGTAVATTTTGYSAGVWHHAFGTWASATSRAAYIDGGSFGSNVTSRTPGSFDTTTIGARMNSGARDGFTDARLAEAAIWNRVLGSAERAALAGGFSPAFFRNGLVFYAPLVRGLVDQYGRVITASGPVVADHPRIIYPGTYSIVGPSAAAPVEKSGTDTLLPKATEGTPALLASFSRTDSLTPKADEGTPSLLAALSRADTLSPKIDEGTVNLLAALARADSVLALITEAATILAGFVRADDLAITVTEASAIEDISTIFKAAVDSLSVAVSDVAALLAALERTDSLTPKVNEGTVNLLAALASSDSVLALIAETTTLLASLSRSDEVFLTVADASNIAVLISGTDALAVTVNEAAALLAALSRVDDFGVLVIDEAALVEFGLALRTAADGLSVTISEAVQILAALNRTDSLSVTLATLANIFDAAVPESVDVEETVPWRPRGRAGTVSARGTSGTVSPRAYLKPATPRDS